jgi:hypothetical protein
MCSTLKSQENIQKAYMEKETETEIEYFIKEKKTETGNLYKKNGIVNTKTQKETSKHRSRKNKKK